MLDTQLSINKISQQTFTQNLLWAKHSDRLSGYRDQLDKILTMY